jgi:hypothetical protein
VQQNECELARPREEPVNKLQVVVLCAHARTPFRRRP